MEEGFAGERLEQQRSHCEGVGARVAGPARRLLGREIEALFVEDASHVADPALPVTEASKSDLALVRHECAARRHEPVIVAASGLALAAVSVLERRADLARDEQGVVDRKRKTLLAAATEDRLEALPLQELEGNVVGGVDLSDPVDLQDVRVLKLGGELHLIHQALDGIGLRRQVLTQLEDGDDLIETRGTQLGRSVFVAQTRGVDLLEKDELAELFSLGHGGPFPGTLYETGEKITWPRRTVKHLHAVRS